MSGFVTERYVPLVRGLSEVTDGGRLAGNFEAYRLVTDASLIAVWEDVAPSQKLATIEQAPEVARSIVFDIDEPSRRVFRLLRDNRPLGMVISFFEEYLPCLMARTFSPTEACSPRDIGPGIIILHTPRTGSHFLTSMIAALGSFGVTEEWIRPTVVEAVRLGIIRFSDHLRRCASFQRATARHWSAVLSLPYLEDIFPYLDVEDRTGFEQFVSDSHVVLLTRVNRPAQIWSTVRAVESRKFFMIRSDQREDTENIDTLSAEMYWLWLAFTAGKLRQWEDQAEALARVAGRALERVYYEELLEVPIAYIVHRRVFGRFYEKDSVLNPSASWYRKQSTSRDLDQIEKFASIYRSIKEFNLHDVEKFRLEMWGRKARETDEGAIIDFDRVECIITEEAPKAVTALVVEFAVGAPEGGALRCRALNGSSPVLAGELLGDGAYVLVVTHLQSEKCQFTLNVETVGSHTAGQLGGGSFHITRVYSLEADPKIPAYFNWMKLVTSGETSALYRCI